MTPKVNTAADVDRLRTLVAELDRLLTPAQPEQFAAVDPDGYPGVVAAGELIESAWGNAVVDKLRLSGTTNTTQDGRLFKLEWNNAFGVLTIANFPADAGNGVPGDSTELVVVSLPAVPYIDGRRVRIAFSGTVRGDTPGDLYRINIRRGVGTAGSSVAAAYLSVERNGGYIPFEMTCVDAMVAAAGSPTQWCLTMARISGGTGNLAFLGTATLHNQMWIEDVGPLTKRT